MLQYSIRDILWLTSLVSVLSLWAIERGAIDIIDYLTSNRQNQQRMTKIISDQAAKIEQLSAVLEY